ncbi:unnamed protein product [Laminaria digitata]
MHWGVACITARADVYAMMTGSVSEDQISTAQVTGISTRQTFSQYEKNSSSNITHVVFSARTIFNPNPRHYGISCAESKHKPLKRTSLQLDVFISDTRPAAPPRLE